MSPVPRYRAPKGMQDILPPATDVWQRVHAVTRQVFSAYGFREIMTPIVESTEIFLRSIGEHTDIVEKEMYTFQDKAGRSITLRPEGTASVVRCFVENNLQSLPAPQKFFYTGPMFRYERPQSGRFRQFYQIGVEAFSDPHPRMDAEVIAMLMRSLDALGLRQVALQMNSIGCSGCRPGYREELLGFLSDKIGHFCEDCRRRSTVNPLRVLDCKVERCITMRTGAPKITDSLCPDCGRHFAEVRSFLDVLGIPYAVNPDMVRGLDYYTRTTFEVLSGELGAQSAVAAGGRYDRLVREFGGADTPAIGFALGMERLTDLVRRGETQGVSGPEAFIVCIGERAAREAFSMADRFRKAGIWTELGDAGASPKSQLRRADRLAARYVFLLGDEELETGSVKWKRLADSTEGAIPLADAAGLVSGANRPPA